MMRNSTQNFRILNPIIRLEWAGWESDTLKLQRNGWQIAVKEEPLYHTLQIVISHKYFELHGLSDMIRLEYVCNYFDSPKHYLDNITIPIKQFAHNFQTVQLNNVDFLKFESVNAIPELAPLEIINLNDLRIFSPIRKPEHEILIDPNDTQRLLDRVLELQSPKQKEIRGKRDKELKRFLRENSINEDRVVPYKSVFAEVLI